MAERYDELKILAYVEGDMPAKQRVAFETELARDPMLQQLVSGLIADRAALRSLSDEPVPANLMDAVNERLEREMLLRAGDDDSPVVARIGGWGVARWASVGGVAALLAFSAVLAWQTLLDTSGLQQTVQNQPDQLAFSDEGNTFKKDAERSRIGGDAEAPGARAGELGTGADLAASDLDSHDEALRLSRDADGLKSAMSEATAGLDIAADDTVSSDAAMAFDLPGGHASDGKQRSTTNFEPGSGFDGHRALDAPLPGAVAGEAGANMPSQTEGVIEQKHGDQFARLDLPRREPLVGHAVAREKAKAEQPRLQAVVDRLEASEPSIAKKLEQLAAITGPVRTVEPITLDVDQDLRRAAVGLQMWAVGNDAALVQGSTWHATTPTRSDTVVTLSEAAKDKLAEGGRAELAKESQESADSGGSGGSADSGDEMNAGDAAESGESVASKRDTSDATSGGEGSGGEGSASGGGGVRFTLIVPVDRLGSLPVDLQKQAAAAMKADVPAVPGVPGVSGTVSNNALPRMAEGREPGAGAVVLPDEAIRKGRAADEAAREESPDIAPTAPRAAIATPASSSPAPVESQTKTVTPADPKPLAQAGTEAEITEEKGSKSLAETPRGREMKEPALEADAVADPATVAAPAPAADPAPTPAEPAETLTLDKTRAPDDAIDWGALLREALPLAPQQTVVRPAPDALDQLDAVSKSAPTDARDRADPTPRVVVIPILLRQIGPAGTPAGASESPSE